MNTFNLAELMDPDDATAKLRHCREWRKRNGLTYSTKPIIIKETREPDYEPTLAQIHFIQSEQW